MSPYLVYGVQDAELSQRDRATLRAMENGAIRKASVQFPIRIPQQLWSYI